MSPVEVNRAPGTYQVRVEREGYAAQASPVEINDVGETATVRFVLVEEINTPTPSMATAPTGSGLLIISTQPWSQVYLRGRLLGTTPLRVQVPAGRHRLELRHPGRPARTRRVVIRAGDETRVSLAL